MTVNISWPTNFNNYGIGERILVFKVSCFFPLQEQLTHWVAYLLQLIIKNKGLLYISYSLWLHCEHRWTSNIDKVYIIVAMPLGIRQVADIILYVSLLCICICHQCIFLEKYASNQENSRPTTSCFVTRFEMRCEQRFCDEQSLLHYYPKLSFLTNFYFKVVRILKNGCTEFNEI